MVHKVIRFRGKDYIDPCWHTNALWAMLRDVEPDNNLINEVWLPLLEDGVELVEYGYCDSSTGVVYDLAPMFGDSISNYAEGVF